MRAPKVPGDKVDAAHTVSTQRSTASPIAKGPLPFSQVQATLTGRSCRATDVHICRPEKLGSKELDKARVHPSVPSLLSAGLSFRATVKEFGQKHQGRKPYQEQGWESSRKD